MAVFAAVAVFSNLAAWILFLLVSLSVPIINSIWLAKLQTRNITDIGRVAGKFTFGVWGLCLPTQPSSLGVVGGCSDPQLGYTARYISRDHTRIVEIISNELSTALVLNPIACGFAFLALVVSIAALLRRNAATGARGLSVPSILATFLAALVGLAAFAVDIALVVKARNKVDDAFGAIASVSYGSAVWLALVAAALLWIATLGSFAGLFSARRKATY